MRNKSYNESLEELKISLKDIDNDIFINAGRLYINDLTIRPNYRWDTGFFIGWEIVDTEGYILGLTKEIKEIKKIIYANHC